MTAEVDRHLHATNIPRRRIRSTILEIFVICALSKRMKVSIDFGAEVAVLFRPEEFSFVLPRDIDFVDDNHLIGFNNSSGEFEILR